MIKTFNKVYDPLSIKYTYTHRLTYTYRTYIPTNINPYP